MNMSGYYPLNQLQFQVGGTSTPAGNMAVKFRTPQPIIVEKFGTGSQTPLEMSLARGPISQQQLKPAFEFSSVSEDKLSHAVRMARKDLQTQKQQQLREEAVVKAERQPKASPKRKGYIYPSAARGLAKRKDKKVAAVKRENKKPKSRPTTPVQGVVHMATRPAAPVSPPVRDSDPYAPIKNRGQDGQILDEISRLRNDMHTCMSQIGQIEEQAKRGGSSVKPRPLPGTEDLPSEEQDRRRELKAEENAARTTRTLYALQQQVKDIQDELKKTRPDQLMGKRKSRLLSRLAAAHRAAVRALQAFVTQLADVDLAQGLPRTYREFALLVRQLSLCCAQLEIAGESGVPDSVTNLLKDMANMNDVMEEELRGPEHFEHGKKSSMATSKSHHCHHNQPPAINLCKPYCAATGKENRGKPGGTTVPFKQELGVSTSQRLARSVKQEVKGGSPDRQSALKRGIEALLRAAGPDQQTPRSPSPGRRTSPSPPPDVPRLAITPRTPRAHFDIPEPCSPRRSAVPPSQPHVAWEVPVSSGHGHGYGHGQSQGQKKSYLLPSALQKKRAKTAHRKPQVHRERVSRPVAITGPNHYAEPTVATILKKVHQSELPQPGSYPPQPRSPSPTPRSPRTPRRILNPDAPSTFAEPTLASALKAVPPSDRTSHEERPLPFFPTSHSPRRSEVGSPRREYLPSVRSPRTPRRSARSILTTGRSESPFNTARQDIARQVFVDRDAAKRMKDIEDLKRSEKARLSKLRTNLNETDEWVRQTEQRIRQKIQPLLQDAKEISWKYEELQRAGGGSLRADLAKRAVETVECNADVLADMILHDVLEETVVDLQEMEDESAAEEVAWHMTQAPSIANLVKRLQDMELEQEQIRQKWATVVYEDERGHQRSSYSDVAGSERPSTPPPIQLTRQDEVERQLTPTRTRMMRVPHPHEEDTEPDGIYFTREPQQTTQHETLHLSTRYHGTSAGATHNTSITRKHSKHGPTTLSVNKKSLESIHGYVQRYEAHLKRTVTNPIGNFNPWHVTNELADAILSDCIEGVAKELEQINNDVVNHIYQTEFKEADDDDAAAH